MLAGLRPVIVSNFATSTRRFYVRVAEAEEALMARRRIVMCGLAPMSLRTRRPRGRKEVMQRRKAMMRMKTWQMVMNSLSITMMAPFRRLVKGRHPETRGLLPALGVTPAPHLERGLGRLLSSRALWLEVLVVPLMVTRPARPSRERTAPSPPSFGTNRPFWWDPMVPPRLLPPRSLLGCSLSGLRLSSPSTRWEVLRSGREGLRLGRNSSHSSATICPAC